MTWNCDGPGGENGIGSPIHLNNQKMTTFGNQHHHHNQGQGQRGGEYSDSASPSPPNQKNGFLNSASSVSTSIYQSNSNNIVPQSQANLTTFTSSNTTSTSMSGKSQLGNHLVCDPASGIYRVAYLWLA